MPAHSEVFVIETNGSDDIVDLTPYARDAVSAARIREGTLTLFAAHSTCAITTMELEPGAATDLKAWLEMNVPASDQYRHNILNHDSNGHSHLRAALIGPDVTIPVAGGDLVLGTWQTPILIDCDDRPRSRRIIARVIGE